MSIPFWLLPGLAALLVALLVVGAATLARTRSSHAVAASSSTDPFDFPTPAVTGTGALPVVTASISYVPAPIPSLRPPMRVTHIRRVAPTAPIVRTLPLGTALLPWTLAAPVTASDRTIEVAATTDETCDNLAAVVLTQNRTTVDLGLASPIRRGYCDLVGIAHSWVIRLNAPLGDRTLNKLLTPSSG